MPPISSTYLPLVQIMMGSALFAVGFMDFSSARELSTDRAGLLERLEEQLFGELSEEVLLRSRQAASMLMILSGLCICLGVLLRNLI